MDDAVVAPTQNLSGPLPAEAQHTYRWHFRFAMLDAIAAGILSNVPMMALKAFSAADWQLSLRLSISSVGMFAAVLLAGVLARSRKMPFVFLPGMSFGVCTLLSALVSDPLLFLSLHGVGSLFEVGARMSIAPVIRLNYPATHRGFVTGRIRSGSSLVVLACSVASALLLDHFPDHSRQLIAIQMLIAGALSLASYFCFRQIKVNEQPAELVALSNSSLMQSVKFVAREDKRFQNYLLSAFLFSFCGLFYASYIPAVVVKDLHCNYLGSTLLVHVLPGALSFICTAWWGMSCDRNNLWRVWGWIRAGWALDPLLLAASVFVTGIPVLCYGVAGMGRAIGGAVAGGSWILWWQIGITHFAKPGAQTSHYMAMVIFLNGVSRLLAPMAGAWVLFSTSRSAVLVIGGVGVGLSAAHAFYCARQEKNRPQFATVAAYESSFSAY